jgi:hypothetical protein
VTLSESAPAGFDIGTFTQNRGRGQNWDRNVAAVHRPDIPPEQQLSKRLTRAEVALAMGVSAKTVSRWPIPVISVGRTVRYNPADVLSFLDSRKVCRRAVPPPAPRGAAPVISGRRGKARRAETNLAAELRNLMGQ